ncbi:uncharacterized protein G2W53_013735 [Senna tora]|uniref:Uncharacterized protein n=1 Tax=Senna tora TaxID=362788 RepID=A0A834U124_9FABA|nr:uncharacterized protein G2W53_013735 [Senna tora]
MRNGGEYSNIPSTSRLEALTSRYWSRVATMRRDNKSILNGFEFPRYVATEDIEVVTLGTFKKPKLKGFIMML